MGAEDAHTHKQRCTQNRVCRLNVLSTVVHLTKSWSQTVDRLSQAMTLVESI